MLRTNIAVAQLEGFTQRKLNNLPRMGRERDMPRWRRSPLADHLFDLAAGCIKLNTFSCKGFRRHAFTFTDKAKEKMLRTNIVMLQRTGFFLGQDDHTPCPVCKTFKHKLSSCIVYLIKE